MSFRNVKDEEYAAILCGLRLLQEKITRYGRNVVISTYDHFNDTILLSVDEIDSFCEELNTDSLMIIDDDDIT